MDCYLTNMEGKTENAKLNCVRQGIAYLSLQLDPAGLKANRVTTLIKNWYCVLGKEVRQANRNRLEDMSSETPEFGKVENFVKCKALHRLFDKTLQSAKSGKPVSQHDRHSITV